MKKILLLILVFSCICSISSAESEKELFDSGVKQFKEGHYKKAVDSFSKLIALEPENADAYKNRGVTYMKLENFDQAIADLEKAKSLFPELRGLYSNLGVAWYYKKEYQKAIEYYNTEIEMAPENAIVYFNRALCLTELGENKKALEDLSKTLELRPDFYWAICYKADILASEGKIAEAVETYKKAVRIAPENVYAIDKLSKLDKLSKNAKMAKSEENSQTGTSGTVSSKSAVNPDADNDQPKKSDTSKNTIETKNRPSYKYTVQLGAFLNKTNAQRMKEKLLSNGFESRIVTHTDASGKTWNIVKSGGYPDKASAREAVHLLKQKLNIDSIIRPHEAR